MNKMIPIQPLMFQLPRVISRILVVLFLMTLAVVATGCASNSKTPMDGLISVLTPETPGQVARDAFNVYDADVRRDSINALAGAKFGGEAPYLRLYRLLIDDPDPTVRASCCKALGLHGEVEDALLLIPRTRDDATTVRWEAAKALGKIHHPAAMDALTTLLAGDSDADVRQAAAIACGQYATIAVFNQLVGALDDRSYTVVAAAHQSLKILTGYDFGVVGTSWLIFARKDPGAIFKHQQQYTWQPYEKPRSFWAKMQFWKEKPQPPEPQIPTGMTPVDKQSS